MIRRKSCTVICIIMALAFLLVSCEKNQEDLPEETEARIRTEYTQEELLEEIGAEAEEQEKEESDEVGVDEPEEEDAPEDKREEEEPEEAEPESEMLTTRELAMLDEPLYEIYKLLDTKEFFDAFYDEQLEGIMEQVQSPEIAEFELEEGFDCGSIPEELVRSLGEAFYEDETELWTRDSEHCLSFGSVTDLAAEYGAREFQIWGNEMRELIPGYTKLFQNSAACKYIYHFNLSEDQENFLFCFEYRTEWDCVRHIVLTEYTDGELIKLMDVQTLQPKWSKVIAYHGSYYYVAIEENYNNRQMEDTIRIQKLGVGMEEEKLLIRYVADEFTWEDLCISEENYPEGMEEYIEGVKEELFAGNYLEDGSIYEEIAYFDGDETERNSLYEESREMYDYRYYSVDFANIGVPVWIGKYISMPGKIWNRVDMTAQFYIRSPYSGRIWRMKNDFSLELRQMWFKEMDGRIYTFQIACPNDGYYVSPVRDSQLYIYQLNVLLVEGNQVTVIHKALATAKMHFIVTKEEAVEWVESYRPVYEDGYYD